MVTGTAPASRSAPPHHSAPPTTFVTLPISGENNENVTPQIRAAKLAHPADLLERAVVG
jgi:hypothetical protein